VLRVLFDGARHAQSARDALEHEFGHMLDDTDVTGGESHVGVVEDGTSLTIIERDDPYSDPEYVGEFQSAHRVWFGITPGTDWLHEEIERRLGPLSDSFVVTSRRSSAHIGASAEVATVILELLAAGIAGKVISDLIDWAKNRAREKQREQGDEWTPDFFERWEGDDAPAEVASAMRGELAELVGVPEERLETVEAAAQQDLVAVARYRDRHSGKTYRVEVARREAIFTVEE
jgi:hypothetical protein